MKQKLTSKLKRVALALFAALCVGNVWAADFYGGEYHCYFDINTKTITATSDIWAYSARTYIGYYTFSYTDNTGAEVTESIYGSRKSIGAEDWGTLEDSFTLPNFKLGSSLSVVLKIMYVSNNQYKDITDNWEPNPRKPVVFETAKVMSTKCEWTNNPKKFIVSGVSGSPKVKIEYAIGDSNLSESDVVFESKTLDVLDANFSLEIPYESEEKILWRAYAVFEDESEELFINGDNVSLFSRERIDDTKQTYTWTGNGDGGSWKDVDNWVSDASSSFGYPGTKGGAYYRTMVRFDGNAEVDLDGESFGFVDDGAFAFAENATVKFKNGHIYAASGHLGVGGSDDAFGADGVTIIFNNIGLHLFNGEDFSTKGCQEVTPRSNTTLVFEGDFNKNSTLFNDSSAWRYHPKKTYSNTKFVFKDGEIRCGYVSSADYSMSLSGTHKVEITNAIFRINTNADGAKYGVADEVIFRNGVDSGSKQARLWIYNSSSNMDGKIKLPSVIDIKLPETPYSTAYIQAYSFIETPSSAIKIDATDYVKGEKVPLIKLTEASTYIPTLKVFVNGEETTARNAKLVWEGTTLYFQQDSQNAASIGTAEYATLGEAVEAATSGATITVLNDCSADTACVIANKTLTIDLNGKTVKANDTAAATDGNGVFWVQAGGVLTLEDSSEEKTGTVDGNGGNAYKMAIWADGGKVVINGGNYVNENDGPDNQYDLIYVKNGGSVEINGGTFKCETPNWTLNSHDTAKGTILVKGGTFYQFNPANCTTEGANTNFCADGLCGYVVETVDGVDVYGVAAAVATIGEAKFVSLDAAIAAAGADDEVLVVADIATDAAFEITKTVAVNLNGKTIATTQDDTEGNGVFWVKTGGELTLNGEGTVNGVGGNIYNIAIWADGGKVIINGGTYTNEGAQDDGPDGAHFDLIYVKNGGSVEINGGTFKCETPNWTLNSHDTAKGTIVVKGGTFYQFNPSDCATEGAGTNWCAEGLKGAESVENAGYYEIVKAWTAPLPDLEEGDSFSGDYEYTPEVLAELEAAAATSVDVKVNGVELKGDEAIKALNTAVASFDDALTFDGTAAILDIEIKVTEVNTEDPAASTVVVKRGTDELTVKATPKVKYFYPETKTWGSDKPESGAVLFKLVF